MLKATLTPKANNQKFNASKNIKGKYVRLTLLSNNGSKKYTELFSFKGYGKRSTDMSPIENISGTYDPDYSKFHIRQQGAALTGCYEYDEGILDGVIEGRLMKITWTKSHKSGPAVMVFSQDEKVLRDTGGIR